MRRTSWVVLDRRQPRTQPQPLRRVKVSRLRRGDHPDDEHPAALVRQRAAAEAERRQAHRAFDLAAMAVVSEVRLLATFGQRARDAACDFV